MSIFDIEQLMEMEISTGFGEPVPIGFYNAVISGVEVGGGPKGPYLNIETTVHDEEYRGRKVWRVASFSEKALGMPGGIAELLQITDPPDLDRSVPPEELPAEIARAVLHSPIQIEVEHDQVKRGGVPQQNADGTPEMRSQVRSFSDPPDDFIDTIKNEAAGIDDDLPF